MLTVSHVLFRYLKYAFLPILVSLPEVITAQNEENDSSRTVLFIGPSVHASYRGISIDHDVHLSPEFSPGLELGIGNRSMISSDLDICLGLGADISVIRNSFIDEFTSTHVFKTTKHYSIFLEGALCLHTRPFGDWLLLYAGYRLNAFLPHTFEYGESSPTEQFYLEGKVNPNPALFHGMVLRAEFTFRSRDASRQYGIAIQGVGGGTSKERRLVDGIFTYESEGDLSFGGIDSQLAHLSVLWQVYW